MTNLPVIHLDRSGGGGNAQGSSYVGTFTNYTALTAAFPTANFGDFAVVEDSEGTQWLPWTVGGTYYPEGTYYWNNTEWTSNVADIAEELQNIINNANTQDLASVLTQGNTTNNGQTINALNGGGQLDLRNFADNIFVLSNDNGGYLKAWHYGDDLSSQMGFGLSYVGTFDNQVSIASDYSFADKGTLQEFKEESVYISIYDITNGTGGSIGMGNNALADFLPVTVPTVPHFPSFLSSQGFVAKQSVVNSVAVGGNGLILKTSNTAYVNQLGFNKGEAFELILDNTTATADRTQTLQDKSGIVALTSDILKQKSGIIPIVNFAGNPLRATVVFATPFADANYSISIIEVTNGNKNVNPKVDASPTAVGFTVSLGTGNANNIVDVRFVATKNGEN